MPRAGGGSIGGADVGLTTGIDFSNPDELNSIENIDFSSFSRL